MATEEVPAGAPFAFEVASRFLEEQLNRIDALDTKSGVLLAADGVLAGLLFARQSLIVQAPIVLTLVVALALTASLVLALLAFASRRYESAPAPEAVVRLMVAGGDWLKWRFLRNMLDALEVNRRKLEWKSRFLTAALL